MCPLVSGITTRDAALSVELGMQALDLAVGRATLHSLDDNVQREKEMDGSASDLENEGVLLTGVFMNGKRFQNRRVTTCTSNYSLQEAIQFKLKHLYMHYNIYLHLCLVLLLCCQSSSHAMKNALKEMMKYLTIG